MNKKDNTQLSIILATVGLIIACINLVVSDFETTSIVMLCSLITIWICSLENYKKSNNSKDKE